MDQPPEESERYQLRKRKNKDVAVEDKSRMIWGAEDELKILTGIRQYKQENGLDFNSNLKVFHEFIRGSLNAVVDKDKLKRKIRNLKDKYHDNALKEANGKALVFSNVHEAEAYEHSKKIWGGETEVSVVPSAPVPELEEKCLQMIILQEQLEELQKKLQMSGMTEMELRKESLEQKKLINELRTESLEQKKLINELRNKLGEAENKIIEGEQIRKKLHNTIMELKGNIRVFCRVRPVLPVDDASMESAVISFPTSTESAGRALDVMQNGEKLSFTFDKVFTPDAYQEDVFVEISQLVQSALDGQKVCIFVYGQTGSGKTYTMMGRSGNPDQKGLIPRSLEQIFQTKQSLQLHGWKYEMQVSMLEIYNETIRDLLSTNRSDVSKADNSIGGKQYAIKHDANGNTHVSDLTVMDVCSDKEVANLLDRATRMRSVGKTQMNEQSSRSHFVFTLKISGTNESTDQQVQGVLNLIDLAGSERLSESCSTGDRLKETQAINKSLSSLGDVIFGLSKKQDHIPFRNSKLTYLLKPCLGGDSKTLMFVNVSADPASVGESLCSLRFATRVNSCEIGIPRRQKPHVLSSPLPATSSKQIAAWYPYDPKYDDPMVIKREESERLSKLEMLKRRGKGPPEKGQGKRASKRK